VRAQLFEEFVQANEDWNASTMVINSRTTVRKKEGSVQINVRGGVPTALLFTWRSLSHSFLFFLIIDTRLD